MNINVNNLNNGYSKEVKFEGSINLPKDVLLNGEAKIKGSGTITNSDGEYTFSGEAKAEITMICNNCLEEYIEIIEMHDLIEVFSKTSNNSSDDKDYDDEDYYEREGMWGFSSKDNNINLEKPLITNIFLNMPMRTLCREDCKGLCRICGHDLNGEDCGCDREYRDPRFEGFLHLFPSE
ncbi:MAG: DUF177 domain-containing protein [bacterium]